MILIPTHNELRNLQTYRHFVRKLSREGINEKDYSNIPVIVTEDGKCWLYDGHHRVCSAAFLRIEIPIRAFNIIQYTYRQLEEINFSKGYVTPFDPRKECRKSFHEYKHDIMLKYKMKPSLQELVDYIYDNPNLYKEPRRVNSIEELIPKPIMVKFEPLNETMDGGR